MKQTRVILAAGLLFSIMEPNAAPAQTPIKPSVSDKIMAGPQAQKMAECKRKAKEQKLRYLKRQRFIDRCMAQ